MAEPTSKSAEMESMLKGVFNIDRRGAILNNICAWCKKPATEFKDRLSAKEYQISGLCQICQDESFG
jgi:hypothetical protein